MTGHLEKIKNIAYKKNKNIYWLENKIFKTRQLKIYYSIIV